MVVSVEFTGIQRELTGLDKINMPITEKTVVRDVLDYIRKKFPHIPVDKDLVLTTVNHELASPDRPLKANDVICILPHIGGG
jgi:molybdopterin converting factor small subunit